MITINVSEGKLNSSHKYYILYETINLVNKKFYIGQHSTDNVEDGYLGSGKQLHRAIEKYGEQNFRRRILKFCSSLEELLLEEGRLMNSQTSKKQWKETDIRERLPELSKTDIGKTPGEIGFYREAI